MWEHFHHQADIGIRGRADCLHTAFEEGAMALSAVVCNLDTVKAAEVVDIHCQADEPDILFFDWIGALICEMEMRKMLFCRFLVQIQGNTLTAKAWGETIDYDRHEIAVGVKAATFLELKVYQDHANQWIAQCVVDV